MTSAARAENGYSLVEMVTVMAIMGIVLAGLTQIFTSASKADIDMSNRFQAQQNTRLALDKLRTDVHCAYDVSPNTPNPWTSSQSTVRTFSIARAFVPRRSAVAPCLARSLSNTAPASCCPSSTICPSRSCM